MTMMPEMPHRNCLGMGHLFYQTLPITKETKETERQAKQLCYECKHVDECLEYALKHEEYGIWGGTTENQRHAMRRELGITLHRPESVTVESMRAFHFRPKQIGTTKSIVMPTRK